MIKYILILTSIILFSGCFHSSPYRQVKVNEIIEDKYILHEIPKGNWKIVNSYNRNIWSKEDGTPSLNNWSINGSTYNIHTYTYPFKWVPLDILFDKDEEYFDSDKKIETYSENDKEQGINYKKGWITYINGLRCMGGGIFKRSRWNV